MQINLEKCILACRKQWYYFPFIEKYWKLRSEFSQASAFLHSSMTWTRHTSQEFFKRQYILLKNQMYSNKKNKTEHNFHRITASYAVTITDYTNQIIHFARDNEISFLLIICWTGKEILNQITNEESKYTRIFLTFKLHKAVNANSAFCRRLSHLLQSLSLRKLLNLQNMLS